jgi:hypothetical protein
MPEVTTHQSQIPYSTLVLTIIYHSRQDFYFTSIQLNMDYASAMHIDKNNLGPSYITGTTKLGL